MKNIFISLRKNCIGLLIFHLSGILLLSGHSALASNSVTLYTPYTKISVPPGESINYLLDIINNSSEIQNVDISLSNLPGGWKYTLKSGGWKISQVSILPGTKQTLTLLVEVPAQVNKGSYRFKVDAKGFDSLPLTVMVSEQGTFKTEFTTKLPSMQGSGSTKFTYDTEIKNFTADDQLYALTAEAPRGWTVTFNVDYRPVSSFNVEANHTKRVSVQIEPSHEVKSGKYKILVNAGASTTSASLELEVVITGSYDIMLTTPTGLLSDNISEGNVKRLELAVKNTGSADLKDIKMNYSAPLNWEVVFEPSKIDKLGSGETARVFATVKVAKNAVVGDYITKIEASNQEAVSKAEFRIPVKASILVGWVGLLIIFVAIGSVYYLFRKYGRR